MNNFDDDAPNSIESTELRRTVYEKRGYVILSASHAKSEARAILLGWGHPEAEIVLGLPEVDDRYHVWRIPLIRGKNERLGELVFSAKTGEFDAGRSTDSALIQARLSNSPSAGEETVHRERRSVIARSELRNTIIQGDAEETLTELPAESIDLVFTSPPYFNARPDYTEYAAYEEYLGKMRRIIQQCHRLLSEGRFFVINVAPVLIRRTNRNESSRRIAVPFDLHRIFIEEGFDFIDDIIWEKPSGAGWATGRGRRFSADRTPLQYKAVPVTEYVLVYRKHTERMIDWNIRNHPDQDSVKASKVGDDYERTNIWKLTPSYSKDHPAIFPPELADRVIRYYSFKGDVVLDPFGGSGTVGKVASKLGRRFVLSEMDPNYIEVIRRNAEAWLGREAADVLCINCLPLSAENLLF
jgi:DNA modification methylase